jgi:hypothetical protein
LEKVSILPLSVRGFGVNKDKILRVSGDVIQWLLVKSILIDK